MRQPPAAFGLTRPRWRLTDLRAALPWLAAYTPAGIGMALRRLGIRRHQGRVRVHSPDPAYPVKRAWIQRAVAAARADPGAPRLVYADEFTLYRQPTRAAAYAPRRVEPTADRAARFNSRWRIAAALDATDGRVTWTARTTMNGRGLCHFLQAVRRAYPGDAPLLLVWDNWPPHLQATVLATAAALHIELLWLPTYAPWLNPIEKLWRWLRQDHLHNHRQAERWDTLKATVATFLDAFATAAPALLRYVGLTT